MAGAIILDRLPLLTPCKCHFFKSTDTESQTTYDDYVMQSSVQIFLRNGNFHVKISSFCNWYFGILIAYYDVTSPTDLAHSISVLMWICLRSKTSEEVKAGEVRC